MKCSDGPCNDQRHEYKVAQMTSVQESESFILLQRIPERIVEKAVKGMLPKGRLGRSLFNHLKVFKGPMHPHQAQQAKDIRNIINAKPGKGYFPFSFGRNGRILKALANMMSS